MPSPENYHCTVINIDGTGILIKGESGSGKTSLAMGLLEKAKAQGFSAMLVSDDQAYLKFNNEQNELIATAPKSIAGKIEIHGFGIVDCDYVESSKIDAVVEIVDQNEVQRLIEPKNTEICGKNLPLILTPKQHEAQGVRVVMAWLANQAI